MKLKEIAVIGAVTMLGFAGCSADNTAINTSGDTSATQVTASTPSTEQSTQEQVLPNGKKLPVLTITNIPLNDNGGETTPPTSASQQYSVESNGTVQKK